MDKKRSGFTLMEVVIVLAVIAILGAIIIPNFLGYTDRARLRGDIQSARVIRNAMDLYRVEVGSDVGAAYASEDALIKHLVDSNYLTGIPELQTEDAKWSYDKTSMKMKIDISACPEGVKKVKLSEIESEFIN